MFSLLWKQASYSSLQKQHWYTGEATNGESGKEKETNKA